MKVLRDLINGGEVAMWDLGENETNVTASASSASSASPRAVRYAGWGLGGQH